jgi:arachidonate 15-lipoxygenase
VNADASILDSVMDLAWDASICRSIFKIRTNLEKVLQKTGWRFSRGIPSLSTREFATYLARKDMPKLTEYFIADLGFALDGGRPKHIDDYRKVFVTREVPEVADRYLSDASFANAFVAGANPLLLKRMDHSLPNFPIRQQHLQNVAACRDDDLVTAMAEQRVYYVDFKILGGLRPGKHYQQPKYVYQPLCAFVVPREGGLMQPFAIQLGQESESREIYTPVDGWSWQIAKSMVMVAYSNHHEAVSHLAETHLLLEPIVVSTYRQLSHRHPLYALFFIILRVPCRSTIWLLPGYCSQVNHLTL